MSREDLSAMLSELADEVQPQPMAARAWAKARQIRRRRAMLRAAVTVLLVAATISLYRLPDRSAVPVNPPTPTRSRPRPERPRSTAFPRQSQPTPTRRRTGPTP